MELLGREKQVRYVLLFPYGLVFLTSDTNYFDLQTLQIFSSVYLYLVNLISEISYISCQDYTVNLVYSEFKEFVELEG